VKEIAGCRRSSDMPAPMPLIQFPRDQVDVRLPARQLFHQGDIQACVSCALATCLEAGSPGVQALSARFLFYHVLARWPNAVTVPPSENDTFSRLQSNGISLESLHPGPFARATISATPSPTAIRDGLDRRPRQDARGNNPWRSLSTGHLSESRWKAALHRGKPVLLIIRQNESYLNLNNAGRPQAAIVDTWVSTAGGSAGRLHAVAILGTDERRRAFIVQDSQGPDFGRGGQWYLLFRDVAGSAIDRSFTLEYPE